jgi:Na+/alanine symporter
MSTVNQVREVRIAIVNGIQRILYENESGMSPFNKASVARPIPQPGQGILVANLNKQSA